MVITTSHASLVNGKIVEAPANTVVEILSEKKVPFVFIRHSMDGQLPSIVYDYDGGQVVATHHLPVLRWSILRYLTEIISTTTMALLRTFQQPLVFIGVDPLNACSGILLRKLGKVKKVVFYSADYTKERFKNKFLNACYHALDRWSARNADVVWSVSTRIVDERKKMGLSDEKNMFVPNIPSNAYEKYLANQRDPYRLITLGVLGDQIDFKGMIDAVETLAPEIPQLTVAIVGTGPKEEELKREVRQRHLDDRIHFLGYLSHDRALEEISKSGIGLALYNGNWSFNYYGDSMKCREYFCFGLPVITTDTHSTVEDIKEANAGIVCEMNRDATVKAIRTILSNYDTYARNALQCAKKHENIHTRLIDDLLHL
jgi:glycosyltransferase involved in cell wall biosynthesis